MIGPTSHALFLHGSLLLGNEEESSNIQGAQDTPHSALVTIEFENFSQWSLPVAHIGPPKSGIIHLLLHGSFKKLRYN